MCRVSSAYYDTPTPTRYGVLLLSRVHTTHCSYLCNVHTYIRTYRRYFLCTYYIVWSIMYHWYKLAWPCHPLPFPMPTRLSFALGRYGHVTAALGRSQYIHSSRVSVVPMPLHLLLLCVHLHTHCVHTAQPTIRVSCVHTRYIHSSHHPPRPHRASSYSLCTSSVPLRHTAE